MHNPITGLLASLARPKVRLIFGRSCQGNTGTLTSCLSSLPDRETNSAKWRRGATMIRMILGTLCLIACGGLGLLGCGALERRAQASLPEGWSLEHSPADAGSAWATRRVVASDTCVVAGGTAKCTAFVDYSRLT